MDEVVFNLRGSYSKASRLHHACIGIGHIRLALGQNDTNEMQCPWQPVVPDEEAEV